MGFPATESSVSQIIEKLDSLPTVARDTAVNNSIALSDNLDDFGESILELYNESSPSAREAIAEMFELVFYEPFDNWLDRVERSCDGFSKQKETVREFDSLLEAIADALDSEARTLPRLTESSKTSNLPMRVQFAVSKLSAKSSPAHGMRKLRRKTPIQNLSTRCANGPTILSMGRRMMLARLGAVRISISSQRPAE